MQAPVKPDATRPDKEVNKDVAADLSYDVQIPFAGTYQIWFRVRQHHLDGDNFHLGIGNSEYTTIAPPAPSPEWRWFSESKRFEAGRQTIKLLYRRTGMALDRMLVTALPSWQPTGLGSTFTPPTIRPPAGHPRLFARDADLEGIRSQLSAPQLSKIWARLSNAANNTSNGVLKIVAANATNYDQLLLTSIKAKALTYLLYGNTAKGQEAVEMMSNYLRTVQFVTGDPASRPRGDTILASAMVYDWCYPLLTAGQRSDFIERFKGMASAMEISFPPNRQGALVGHGAEVQLMRDQLGAAVAFYDEAPAIYDVVAARFFADFISARSYSYAAQSHHQGVSYGPVRYMADLYASWIFRRMGAGDVLPATQQMTPYHWLYMRRPDGQLMRDGDTYQSYYMQYGQYWIEPIAYLLPASYYADPLLQHELDLQMSAFEKAKIGNLDADVDDIWHVLFADAELAQQAAPAPLPLSKYFPHPSGMMVARTAWSDGVQSQSGAAIATMKIGGMQYRNHQHLDAGNFQLYYKGSLASASGIYEGVSKYIPVEGKSCSGSDGSNSMGYGKKHDMNYYKRTIAHNAMLVFDPNENFGRDLSNDGGQRWVTPANREETFSQGELLNLRPDDVLPSNQWKEYSSVVAEVSRHQFGPDATAPDFSYLKGDLSKAYSEKVSEVKRSFVFLNLKNTLHPAALIVFDKVVSSNPSFAKTWLLHSQTEPLIEGDTVTIKRVDNGYNGKLVNRTLLPAGDNVNIKPGHEAGQEYLVNGKDYPTLAACERNTEESRGWRVEVSPKAKAASDTFLNVMQVMDANGGPAALPVTMIASEQMSGVQIQDRVVLFAKDGEDLSGPASFVLPVSTQAMQVLVTDLSPGVWSVGLAGGTPVQHEVKADEGTIYFVATAGGSYLLQRGTVTFVH